MTRNCILDFLRDLRDNNSRSWFEANRNRYEAARTAFEDLVAELLGAFGPVEDLTGVTVKDCVFRINRDVRFSKDKSPYKSTMSALLGPDGRKSAGRAYYLHLEPDGNSMLAGGFHDPSPEELGRIRQSLERDAGPFKKIIRSAAFAGNFGALEGESLKTAPQGYAKDHPDITLLRMKQFLAVHRLNDDLAVSGGLVPHAVKVFKAMKPFLTCLESLRAGEP